MPTLTRYLLLLAALSFISILQAKEFEDQPSWAQRSYISVNNSLHTTANWLDKFFADERFEEEQAWTRLKLQWTTSAAEHEDLDSDIRLRGKIILPNLERKWQLVFEGDPEENDITGLERDTESTTALRYVVRENLKRRLSIDAGISGGFNDPSLRLRAQYRIQNEYDNWLLRLRPTVEWDSRDDWEVFVRFDAESQIGERLYFRSSTTPIWREIEDGYQLTQDFTIFRELSPRRYLAFDWLNSFVTEPHKKVDVTRFRVRFRRELWLDKLFIEIAPGVRFQAEDHHEAEAEAFLRFELLFEKRLEIAEKPLEPPQSFDSGPMFNEEPTEPLDSSPTANQ